MVLFILTDKERKIMWDYVERGEIHEKNYFAVLKLRVKKLDLSKLIYDLGLLKQFKEKVENT